MVLNTPNAMILKINIVVCCTQYMETSYVYWNLTIKGYNKEDLRIPRAHLFQDLLLMV